MAAAKVRRSAMAPLTAASIWMARRSRREGLIMVVVLRLVVVDVPTMTAPRSQIDYL
jgi:hypothetical protein